MALQIKSIFTKTSNLRHPYCVKTQFLKFQFSNRRDAQRFCRQRTRNLKNLYISVLDSYTDALYIVMSLNRADIHLRRACNEIQYFIENPDKNADIVRFEKLCASAVANLVLIYSSAQNYKRIAKQWESTFATYFTNISKPFCEGSVLITRIG